MKIISNTEYQEYKDLKNKAGYIYNRVSLNSVTKLEDDIDEPIKDLVAMLALVGEVPLFSCCGFNYEGQHFHKAHQYGIAYVRVERSSTLFWDTLTKNTDGKNFGWNVKNKGTVYDLTFNRNPLGNPFWEDKQCVHYSEELILALERMEGFIRWFAIQHPYRLQEQVTIFDSNESYRYLSRHWQYPPKSAWKVKADDYFFPEV